MMNTRTPNASELLINPVLVTLFDVRTRRTHPGLIDGPAYGRVMLRNTESRRFQRSIWLLDIQYENRPHYAGPDGDSYPDDYCDCGNPIRRYSVTHCDGCIHQYGLYN